MTHEYRLVEQNNAYALQAFKLLNDDLNTNELILYTPSHRLWGETKMNSTHYTRAIYALGQSKIVLIKKNGQPDQLLYLTRSAAQIAKANRYAVTMQQSNAKTSQVIDALGLYRRVALSRMYESGFVTTLYLEKECLVELTQDRISLLRPLERFVHADDVSSDALVEQLKEYDNQLKIYQSKLNNLPHIKRVQYHDNDFLRKLYDAIERDRKAVVVYIHHLERSKKVDAQNLQAFITDRMIASVRQAQKHNQNCTYSAYSGALLCGSFNDACEKAMRVLHAPTDQHNLILEAHQCEFAQNDEKFWALEFDACNDSELPSKLMALCQISGADQLIHQKKEDSIFLVHEDQKYFMERRDSAARQYGVKPFFIWLYNHCFIAIIEYAIDLPFGLIAGLFADNVPSFVEKIKIKGKVERLTEYSRLMSTIKLSASSHSGRFGYMIGSFARMFFEQWAQAIKTVWMTIDRHIKDLIIDYRLGHERCVKKNEHLLFSLQSNLVSLKKQDAKALRKLINSLKKQEQTAGFKKSNLASIYRKTQLLEPHKPAMIAHNDLAVPPYALHSGIHNDLFHVLAHSVQTLVEHYTRNLPYHPTIGLCLLGIYGVGLLSLSAGSLLTSHLLGASYAVFAPTSFHSTHALLNYLIYLVDDWAIRVTLTGDTDPLNAIQSAVKSLLLSVGFSYLIKFVHIDPLGLIYTLHLDKEKKFADASLSAIAKAGLRQIESLEPAFWSEINKKTDQSLALLLNREALLTYLLCNCDYLRRVSQEKKRRLQIYLQETYTDCPELIASIMRCMHVPVVQSIIVLTVQTLVDYLCVALRCLATPITWQKQVWIDLGCMVYRDLLCVAHAASVLVRVMVSFCLTVARAVAHVIFNEIAARLESHTGKHTLSDLNYTVSEKCDQLAMHCVRPIACLEKKITEPDPQSALLNQKQTGRFFTTESKQDQCCVCTNDSRYQLSADIHCA